MERKEIDVVLSACPRYVCRPPRETASCRVSGRTFVTFDGVEYKYDICDHILAADLDSGEWNIAGAIVFLLSFWVGTS